MDEIFKAYLAALIDGEGTIGIGMQPRRDSIPTFKVRVMVTNSHAGLIKLCRDITGIGSVYVSGRKNATNPEWSPMHRWTVVSQDAKDIISFVLPFLLIKRQQADLAMRFPVRTGRRRRGETDEVFLQQQRMYLQMKELNRRGVSAAKTSGVPDDHPLLFRVNRRRVR